MKSLEYLYLLGYRLIKVRNREDVLQLHTNFFETKPKMIRRGGILPVSRTHRLTLLPLDKIESGSIVLDAGCNNGNVGRHLLEKGCAVYGIDVNPYLVQKAREKGLFASVCPVEELTFLDNFFDYCLAFELFEHLYNPEEGLKQLYRVLKMSGTLFGSVPYPFGKFSQSSKHQWIWHQHDFTKESLKRLLEKYFNPKKIVITQRLIYPKDDSYKLFFEATK